MGAGKKKQKVESRKQKCGPAPIEIVEMPGSFAALASGCEWVFDGGADSLGELTRDLLAAVLESAARRLRRGPCR